MKKVIAEYQGVSTKDFAFGGLLKATYMGIIQLMSLVELLIYCYLHLLQFKHNQRMVLQGIVPRDVQALGQRENVIMMSSHAPTFCIREKQASSFKSCYT